MERLVPKEMIAQEIAAAFEIADKMYKVAMEEDNMPVGRGLLAASFTYSLLAKSSPLPVSFEHMQEILAVAYDIVSKVEDDEGSSHVLQ